MKYTLIVKGIILSVLFITIEIMSATETPNAEVLNKNGAKQVIAPNVQAQQQPVPQDQTDTFKMMCMTDPLNPFLCASEITEMSS